MLEFSTTNVDWNERFEKKEKNKLTFENRIIALGLIIFGICSIINSILIYNFFRLIGKL